MAMVYDPDSGTFYDDGAPDVDTGNFNSETGVFDNVPTTSGSTPNGGGSGSSNDNIDFSQNPDQTSNETARNQRQNDSIDWQHFINNAAASGVDAPWMQALKSVWGGASSFLRDNPKLAEAALAGLGNAQKQKADMELAEKKHQWDVEKTAEQRANEKMLYDRRNQSIIDMQPANLGILGGGMYDSQKAYFNSRK